ncbi:PP2C family protein-serine/threonine phosphatase [Aeromicrobium massiliense]|uniref:PP2C family protein-serine/threonine phosphatase n=1 Tax=Aeromicrobium massiliense TaxID=1464554 RepID=UPI000675F98E|nr:GAF domain-containing SpoIIE family protein phosphatase [Aeromicrobium massiliense]
MVDDWRRTEADLFDGILRRTHLSRPADVARLVVEEAQSALGAGEVVLYWVNREQTELVPLPVAGFRTPAPLSLDGSLAGRAFTTSTILTTDSAPGRVRVLVPVVDGTDRLGVVELDLPQAASPTAGADSEQRLRVLERLGHAVALALVSKRAYGDDLELVQRSRPMDLGAELLWSALPPMTYANEGLVIAAMLEPAYENGGDAYDYAVNEDGVHLAIFDGLGHGLVAARLSTFVLAAGRHARRSGAGLAKAYVMVDEAVAAEFGADRFVTGILARLDPATGVLEWVDAGHPAPLVLRDGRVVKQLEVEPATPFGAPGPFGDVQVGREQLEPGDVVVLYTDGVVEARRPDGSFLDVEGLVEFVERESASRAGAPEILRRFRRTLLDDAGTVLGDDATVLLVAWRTGAEDALVPQTVLDD